MASEPQWVGHTSFWHVFPLGMAGALYGPGWKEGEPGGLDLVSSWLDHPRGLGLSGLALGPIFASTSHGYDTTDYYRIDPRLGDDHTFGRLVDAVHHRSMRLVLDGVFNHVGAEHPFVTDVRLHGRDSRYYDYFHVTWDEATGQGPYFHNFEGHTGLITLNHGCPAVQDMIVDVMCHWLARGADGWRLDAAYAMDPAAWATITARVKEVFPDAFLFGEMIHGDYREFVAASGLDSVTQYELWKSIRSSIAERNLFELDWNLRRHNDFLASFVPVTFVSNHDVTRLNSALPDPRDAAIATVLLLTVGGTPCVYYGDEYGLGGVKEERPGGDDVLRPAFPAPWNFHARPEQDAAAGLHHHLLTWRNAHAWAHQAQASFTELTKTTGVLELRYGAHAAQVALNLTDEVQELPVPAAHSIAAGFHAELLDPGLADTRVRLPAHGWAILAVS
ncbi:alpha-amylase [Buchananella hordeovulneris]|uniref:alpha-amylase family glycosyl hydrolase n=1 Tax=Buchananella hordeovulneris TaxID=52770 RepID=UPI000F5EA343|nr:alpha-amylase family glycosyl hydrolase [Buchananella hordeovulneris]RRD53493.1 alpha-amylase [Buchananella hordeovulneris]